MPGSQAHQFLLPPDMGRPRGSHISFWLLPGLHATVFVRNIPCGSCLSYKLQASLAGIIRVNWLSSVTLKRHKELEQGASHSSVTLK